MAYQIGLLTDFGSKAGYVASMKGVILSIAQCNIIDLSHDIASQDIVEAAYFLDNCSDYFPEGFVFLIVVDPGVGSARRILVMKTRQKNQYFIAPDNGLLELIFRKREIDTCIVAENKEYWRKDTSFTFHGRDIMAPLAAHVASGIDLKKLGPEISIKDVQHLDLPEPHFNSESSEFSLEIIYTDKFGNIITNITKDEITKHGIVPRGKVAISIKLEDGIIGYLETTFRNYYDEAGKGESLVLINSENRFEIAVNQGSAIEKLKLNTELLKANKYKLQVKFLE
ncbi:MAG: SAM hydrolase/SAM-dependent halogenase family protein [Promethearchaeota archaeon]